MSDSKESEEKKLNAENDKKESEDKNIIQPSNEIIPDNKTEEQNKGENEKGLGTINKIDRYAQESSSNLGNEYLNKKRKKPKLWKR